MLINVLIFIYLFIFKIFISVIFFFWQLFSQNLKLSKLTEIWCRATLLYALYDFNVYFFKNVIIHMVSHFSVYELMGRDPGKVYLFKANSRNTRKMNEICSNITINTMESCSGVFTVKCFSRNSLLHKYFYPKYKDEQTLYVTSFKIAAIFLNSYFF